MTKDTARDNLLSNISHSRTSFEVGYWTDELIAYDESKEKDKEIDFHGNFADASEENQDAIINPAHYKVVPPGNYPDGLEYMDLMTHILDGQEGVKSHLLGQIMKYSIRIGKKDAELQDAKKIQWYANYLVKQLS